MASRRKRSSAHVPLAEIAQCAGVTPPTVRNWIKTGRLPGTKGIGGHRRVLRTDWNNFALKHGLPTSPQLPSWPELLRRSHRLLQQILDTRIYDANELAALYTDLGVAIHGVLD